MSNLIVSTSPHIRSPRTTRSIMLDVLIALSPAAVASVIFFGLKALLMIAVCVVSAVGSEYLFNLLTKKKQTIGDLSAAVTGLLLAFNLSAKANVWHCIVGSVFAIVIVKCAFGGLGCNFANPAVTARIFLLISFASLGGGAAPSFASAELVASSTPLEVIKTGEGVLPSLLDMFLGVRGGAIGETCILALALGYIYLVCRRVIKWETPIIFIGTVFLLSLAIKGDFNLALYELMGGGLVLGAVFMATDYVTTPINRLGKMVFALGCGLITVLIRFFGSYAEGVSFAILIMNILSPYIEKLCSHKALGGKKNEN